ncbi:MAG: hypothetical protein E4G98_04055 [Promethearchaeota archaeon]|nr:MAG: hypothetical protein E4G98_04055 [Candidatus Lokiarchaeota archaeon]
MFECSGCRNVVHFTL